MTAWKLVEKVYDRNEAELLAAVLRSGGIPVQVVSDMAGGWLPELVKLRGAEVRVPEEHFDEAVALLDAEPEYDGSG